MDEIVNTGDPAMDKEVAEQMAEGLKAAGMSVSIEPNPGGGLRVVGQMGGAAPAPAAPAGVPAAPAVEMPKAGAYELGGTVGAELTSSILQGSLDKTLDWLSSNRSGDDYGFMIGFLAKKCRRDLLDQAVAARPQEVEPLLLRAGHGIAAAWEARGGGTADTISDEGSQTMVQMLEGSRKDLMAAAKLDPQNAVPLSLMIEVATLHESMSPEDGRQAFKMALERNPKCLLAFRNMLRLSSEKWGGSHDEQLEVARLAASKAGAGSDLFSCLYYAHIEIWFYHLRFEESETDANAHLGDPAVQSELNDALENWLVPEYKAGLASPPGLHLAAFWYAQLKDIPRLKRAVQAVNMVAVDHPWHYLGEPTMMWTQALQLTT